MLTTFTSYGKVPMHRQGELIRKSKPAKDGRSGLDEAALMAALAARLDKTGR